MELNPLPLTGTGHDYLLLTEYRKEKIIITLWRKLADMTLNKWSKYKSHWHHVSLKWCKEKGTSSPLCYSVMLFCPKSMTSVEHEKISGQHKEREVPWDSWSLLTKNVKVIKKKKRKNQEIVIDWGTLRDMTTEWKAQSWTGSWNRNQVLVGKCLLFNYSTVSMLISEHGCLKYLLPLQFACECVNE